VEQVAQAAAVLAGAAAPVAQADAGDGGGAAAAASSAEGGGALLGEGALGALEQRAAALEAGTLAAFTKCVDAAKDSEDFKEAARCEKVRKALAEEVKPALLDMLQAADAFSVGEPARVEAALADATARRDFEACAPLKEQRDAARRGEYEGKPWFSERLARAVTLALDRFAGDRAV
jgi:hypothetical protein